MSETNPWTLPYTGNDVKHPELSQRLQLNFRPYDQMELAAADTRGHRETYGDEFPLIIMYLKGSFSQSAMLVTEQEWESIKKKGDELIASAKRIRGEN